MAMNLPGLKRYLREQTAILVMIAILFTGFFNAFTITHEQISGLKQQVAVFGEKVLICTADGYKWQSWKEIMEEKSAPKIDNSKCKFCYSASVSSKITISSVYEFNYVIAGSDIPALQFATQSPRFVFYHTTPRSPPYFS